MNYGKCYVLYIHHGQTESAESFMSEFPKKDNALLWVKDSSEFLYYTISKGDDKLVKAILEDYSKACDKIGKSYEKL
jgi:hypothetical protein